MINTVLSIEFLKAVPLCTEHLKTLNPLKIWLKKGCGFFAYSWKLPAYSGALLLTVDNFSFIAYNFAFYLQLELFCLQWQSASNMGLKGL